MRFSGIFRRSPANGPVSRAGTSGSTTFTDSTTTVKKYSSLMFTLLDEQDNLLKSFSQRVPGLSVRLQSPAFVYLHNTLQRNSTQRPSSSLRSLFTTCHWRPSRQGAGHVEPLCGTTFATSSSSFPPHCSHDEWECNLIPDWTTLLLSSSIGFEPFNFAHHLLRR